MKNLNLIVVGAGCAVLLVICFVVGIALMASGGVQVLIPETGKDGLDWIRDVDDAGGLFFAGGWLVVIGGVLGVVAFLGFYEALRQAHPLMILAPILGAVGMIFVTISHFIPLALAYEFVPGYVDASAAAKASLQVNFDTWAVTSLVANYIGDALVWGVVLPLYAWAALKTKAVPRWIGWVGLVSGAVAGWLGLLSPASSVIDNVTFIGFIGFFVFMGAMGLSLLRRSRTAEELSPAAVH